MARPLAEYFGQVDAADVHDYGFGDVDDFLIADRAKANKLDHHKSAVRLGRKIRPGAIPNARVGVAVLLRTNFLEGVRRHRNIFSKRPPSIVAQFVERVTIVKGRVRDPDQKYWDPDAGKWNARLGDGLRFGWFGTQTGRGGRPRGRSARRRNSYGSRPAERH